MAAPLLRAVQALREAGWLAAQRLGDALVLVSPLTAAEPSEEPDARQLFAAALHDFRAAIGRHNLRELACSPTLFAHYHALSALISRRTPGFTVAYEDLALAAQASAAGVVQRAACAAAGALAGALRACPAAGLAGAFERRRGQRRGSRPDARRAR